MKPAKDSSERLIANGRTFNMYDYILYEDPDQAYSACLQQRDLHYPASVGSPLITKRWRNPTSWSRSAWRSNPCPSGQLTTWLSYNPGYGVVYTEGAAVPLYFDGPPESIPIDLYNLAVNRALSKIKNQKVNLAQAFAEREQTVRLFVNTCHRVAGMYRAFRRRDPKGFLLALSAGSDKNRLKGLPDSFLEFQYGVKPLVSDVYGACDSLNQAERSEVTPYIMHVVGKASSRRGDVHPLGTRANGWFECTSDVRFSCRVHLYYGMRNDLTKTLSELGILNPASLAWELLPFSFVADWVVPVGNYLGLLDATTGLDFIAGTFSGLTKTSVRSTFRSGTAGYWRAAYQGEMYAYDGYAYQRSLYEDFPLPQLTAFKPPWASDRTTHLANAVALVASALHEGKPILGFF